MAHKQPELTVIAGSGRTEKIALSLVHSSGRIDIPVTAIHSIEARQYSRFSKRAFLSAHVEIRLRYDVRARVHRLTRDIIGQPLEVLVGGKSISRPIVREALGNLNVSAFDFDEAVALAAQLRARCDMTGPRPL
jgi:hypothetical protein